jgi:hypothetical protein
MFKRMAHLGSVFLRLALGMSFLSAVADRFGFWGAFGQRNVAWGDFAHCAIHGKLNWFMPSATILLLAWASTSAEILLGFALIFRHVHANCRLPEPDTVAFIRGVHDFGIRS